MRTAHFLVIAQVALLIIFIGTLVGIFSSMEEEVDVTPCGTPIANVAWPWKVVAAFAFGFVMNILVPIAT